MKRFIEGADRGQSTLLPECLDDFIDESNPVRVIDAFVDALDLGKLGFEGVVPETTGRPSYHPSALLKLYIYGYLNRIQSSRRLEREAGRNLEAIWLLRRLTPDDKTVADFRKDNGQAIKKVCAQFVELCRQMGLLTTVSVAIDGSKFKAVNNRDRNFTRAKVERCRAQLEESVARYLSQLDTADLQEPTEALAVKTTRLREKLAKLKEEMGKLAAYEKQMLASPDQQISLTDPDSRSMATSGRGSGVVGYNVQVAVDTEHHLIVTHAVTNVGNDTSQLARMGKQTKAVLEADKLEVVADRGYFNGEELLACEQADIEVTLPKPLRSGAKAQGRFGKQDFVYLVEEDVYRCPAGEHLKYYFTAMERAGDAPLLDECMPDVRHQASMHHGQRAPHHALGARACRGSSAALSRCEPTSHAPATRDGRAPVRHDEGAHGCVALPHQDAAEGRHRNGAQRAGLQSDARHEHHRRQAADRRDGGLTHSSLGACAALKPLRMRTGRTKLASTLNRKNRFGTVVAQRILNAHRHPLPCVITRPRPKAVLRPCAPSQSNISSGMRRDVETGQRMVELRPWSCSD
jgi:transposase